MTPVKERPGLFSSFSEGARVARDWFGAFIIAVFFLIICGWIIYLIWPAILTMVVVIGALLLIVRPWRHDRQGP